MTRVSVSARRIVVFDLGGVLIDWNPRYLFRKLAPNDPDRMERFLRDVCHHDWNEQQDAGRSFAEAIADRHAKFPEWREWIDAYAERWPEMLGGSFEPMVEALARLKAKRTPVYALTNWSAETFPHGRARFPFLALFDGIVVSGEEKVKKPDPRIFDILCRRFSFVPHEAIFIDDVEANVRAAERLGFAGIHHQTPTTTLDVLKTLGLLTA